VVLDAGRAARGGDVVTTVEAGTVRRGARLPAVPGSARPVLVVAGSLVLAYTFGFATGRHAAIPWSVLVDAMVRGCPEALFAVGLVLVYRAARIINFSHGSMGAAAAIVFLTLQAEGWPWALCALAAVGGAVVAGMLIELALLRRFSTAPRLVLTVVTIGAGQLLVSLAGLLPRWRYGIGLGGGQSQEDLNRIPRVPAHSPFTHLRREQFPLVFTGDHAVAAVVTLVVVAGLAVFFRRSAAGIAIRGAAENSEKASTLGISTGALSSMTWAITAGLAGLAAVLSLPIQQGTLTSVGAGLGTGVLLRGLAAAVIGRMENLPMTFAAAIGIAVVDRAVFFSTTTSSYTDVALLLLLGVALTLQRGSLGRADTSVSGGWAAAEEIRGIPRALIGHRAVRAGRRYTIAALAVAAVLYPFAMSPSQVFMGGTFAIYGIVAVSLVVLTGWGGQISLGQFALVAVGASVGGALTSRGWPFLVALPIASVVGACVAVVLGLPALRIKGLFLAVTTLAFAVVMSTFILDSNRFPTLLTSRVPRPKLLFIDSDDERVFYFVALAGLAVAVFIAQGLRRTRTGRVLIGMRDNERAAQALGLSLVRTRLVTFAIAGFLASFAGVLYAAHNHTVRADAFGPEQSIDVFLMAVIGGLGSVSGVLTGAAYIGLVQLVIPGELGRLLASGAGVLMVLLFYPAGLGGAVYAARDSFLRRVALRDKIYVPSLLGDIRKLDGEESRAPLAVKPATGANVAPTAAYTLVSDIADAGKSQRGKGWVYG
jgi:branched-chain amino acid transport system permease protein